MNPWHVPNGSGSDNEDQLYLLTLCLELQLDLLLVALRPDPAPSTPAEPVNRHWPRWVGDTLDLTGDLPSDVPLIDDVTVAYPSPVAPAAQDRPAASRPERADDATPEEPDPAVAPASKEPRPGWLAARYRAIGDAIDEMLGNAEVGRNPAVVDRLLQARATCDERLADLTSPPPVVGVRLDADGEGVRPQVEAGHFLG